MIYSDNLLGAWSNSNAILGANSITVNNGGYITQTVQPLSLDTPPPDFKFSLKYSNLSTSTPMIPFATALVTLYYTDATTDTTSSALYHMPNIVGVLDSGNASIEIISTVDEHKVVDHIVLKVSSVVNSFVLYQLGFAQNTGAEGFTGPQGPQGVQGASFRAKGEWTSGQTYTNDSFYIDVVTHLGSSFYCKVTHTSSTSNKPSETVVPTETTQWGVVAIQGAQGPMGLQGDKGDQGLQGPPGDNGQSLYTWLKYADTPTTGMSDSPTGKTYIGLAYNKPIPTESASYSDYTWALIKGDQGIPGTNGTNGQTYYTWIKYADTPTTGISDDPTGKVYMGIAYNKTTATESTIYGDYSWSLIQGPKGADGLPGPPGDDGQTLYTWVKYADDANGTNISDSPVNKKYIGIAYNKSTSVESTTATDYSWSLIQGPQGIAGTNGTDGQTYYTWIKYADTPTTGMSDSPTGKSYMGIAYNKTSSTKSVNYADYSWSLIQGPQGLKGDQGIPGAPGSPGPRGISYRNMGAWVSTTTYVNNTSYIDTVGYNGSLFACIKTTSIGITPPDTATNNSDWMCIVAKGTDQNLLDWVQDWNSNKVVVGSQSIITPKIFAGINGNPTGAPMLTGIAIGRDVLGGTNTQIGIVGYNANNVNFQIGVDGSATFGRTIGKQITISTDGTLTLPKIAATDLDINVGRDLDITANKSITMRVTEQDLGSMVKFPVELDLTVDRGDYAINPLYGYNPVALTVNAGYFGANWGIEDLEFFVEYDYTAELQVFGLTQVTYDEAKTRIDSNYTEFKNTADGLAIQIGNTNTRLGTAEANISANAKAITFKVSTTDYNGNTIASIINQTATTVQIAAEKLELSGYATFTNLSTAGQTIIDGANLRSGTVTADTVVSTWVYAGNITADQITGDIITGKRLQTASNGAYTMIDHGWLGLYVDSTNVVNLGWAVDVVGSTSINTGYIKIYYGANSINIRPDTTGTLAINNDQIVTKSVANTTYALKNDLSNVLVRFS